MRGGGDRNIFTFGHVERMGEERLKWNVEGRRDRGRSSFRYFDRVSNARLVELRDAKFFFLYKKQWRDFVNLMKRGANVKYDCVCF